MATVPKRVAEITQRTCPEHYIRERAYYIYLERSGRQGDALSDWLQAERELSGERKRGMGR